MDAVAVLPRQRTQVKGVVGAVAGRRKLDLQLLDLNEGQEINAPENPKPFSALAAQLNSLGLNLGGLGAGAGAGSSGSSGSASSATAENVQKYTECVQDAGSDTAKIQKCSDLLAAP